MRHLLTGLLLLAGAGLAQTAPHALVGAWHNVEAPPIPQTPLIFSADGFYSQTTIPQGRTKPKNDFDHRTREELMKQFGGVRAFYGSWKTEGNTLLRLRIASVEPENEGTQTAAEFRIEGDILILKSKNGPGEARFRRMK